MSIYDEWLAAKEAERVAIDKRREIEDALISEFGVTADFEGTSNFEDGEYKIKVVARLNRKVDGDKAQEIAAELGLLDHLPSLFRWKPEINMTAWKSADKSITEPLLAAITTTPGRPSFTITKE